MKTNYKTFFIFIVLFCCTIRAFAQTEEGYEFLIWGMDEVVSIASMTKETIGEAPSVVSIINRQQIDNMGARTLGDIINLIPGFDVIRAVPAADQERYLVRGKGSYNGETLLIMVDGIRQNDLFVGSGTLVHQYYFLQNIEKIEVIRGPGSALYGANAFVGVINLVTRKAETEDSPTLVASIEGGSFDAIRAKLYNAFKGEKWNLTTSLAYNKDEGDDYEDLGIRMWRDIPESSDPKESWDIDLKATYQSGDLEQEMAVRHWERIDEGYLADGWDNRPVAGLDNKTHHKVSQAFWRLKSAIADKGKLNFTMSWIRHWWRDYYPLVTAQEMAYMGMGWHYYASVNPIGLVGGPDKHTENYMADLIFEWELSSNQYLTSGINYTYSKVFRSYAVINMPLSPDPDNMWGGLFLPPVPVKTRYDVTHDDPQKVFGIFIQDKISFSDEWFLTLGIRYDDYNNIGDTINPRAVLVYKYDANTSFKLLYNNAFRAPSYIELYAQSNPTNLGNPDLEPETIEVFEFVFQKFFLEKLQFDFNIYYHIIEENIYHNTVSMDVSEFLNYGTHTNLGFEIELKYLITDRMDLTVNFSHTKPEDDDTGRELHDFSENCFNLIYNWQIMERLFLNLSASAREDRGRVLYDPREDVEGYELVNTKISYYPNENWEIYLKGFNIFDEEYYSPDFFYQCWLDLPNRGAQFLFGVKFLK